MKITDKKLLQHLVNKGLVNKKDIAAVDRAKSFPKGTSSEQLLFEALVPTYGNYFDGGELVMEYRPLDSRKFRLDVAMPNYQLGIEVDGLKGHAFIDGNSPNINGFKRDREKDMILTANGWHIIRCMRSQIQKELHLIVNAINEAMKLKAYVPVNVRVNKNNICVKSHKGK
jgi:hypothetical protein